jgi:hypothetical protein
VQLFGEMLPLIERQATCAPLLELGQGVVNNDCPAMKKSLGVLAIGFLVAAVGLTITGFLICACWRKLVKSKVKGAVAPDGEEDKQQKV